MVALFVGIMIFIILISFIFIGSDSKSSIQKTVEEREKKDKKEIEEYDEHLLIISSEDDDKQDFYTYPAQIFELDENKYALYLPDYYEVIFGSSIEEVYLEGYKYLTQTIYDNLQYNIDLKESTEYGNILLKYPIHLLKEDYKYEFTEEREVELVKNQKIFYYIFSKKIFIKALSKFGVVYDFFDNLNS